MLHNNIVSHFYMIRRKYALHKTVVIAFNVIYIFNFILFLINNRKSLQYKNQINETYLLYINIFLNNIENTECKCNLHYSLIF